ncbi:hypothetical protein [Henriciella marina]|uniref:hypothetical protein n=1 Tax=Henriciella marina TaxID=453851 RepID=UPI0003665A06|nr:hypothetical protein [Henriciella marina]
MFAMRLLASWLFAVFLIFVYVNATLHPLPNPPEGFVKLFDRPGDNVIFQTMVNKTGIALLEPTGRVVVALFELLLCVLLFIPGTCRLAAGLSVMLMTGAVTLHLMPDVLGRELPASTTVFESETDFGRVFALAVSMLAVSVLLFFVHPEKRERR